MDKQERIARYLFVKQKEYLEFTYTAKRSNRINNHWRSILKGMPNGLYQEVKTKPTNLIPQNKGEFSITNAEPYQFETDGGSKKLNDYLNQFAIFVESDSEEVNKWRETVQGKYKTFINGGESGG